MLAFTGLSVQLEVERPQCVVQHGLTTGNPAFIDHVVLTHNDGDHAGGLAAVLESFRVGALWMLRPWLYAEELLPRFARFTSAENLRRRLRALYPNIASLEELALAKGIPIFEPLQGLRIGAFTVLAPSKNRYIELILSSDRTPEVVPEEETLLEAFTRALGNVAAKAITLVRSAWGAEVFPSDETSAENEMSVVQFALLNGHKILLTADSGRGGLDEAIRYAPFAGLVLPGIDMFQVPHHGSRRNVSTEILNRLLGPILPATPVVPKFSAFVSSAKADEAHPRKAVVRAMQHRGGSVLTTEGKNVYAFSVLSVILWARRFRTFIPSVSPWPV